MKKIAKILIIFLVIFMQIVEPINYCEAAEEDRIVYLTFDDGPSPNNTLRILNILNENNVRATFFVVGENVKKFPDIVRKMNRDNMAIYPHCNNHEYSQLYSSKEYYFDDLLTCEKLIEETTGKDIDMNFVRMPGGSDNQVGSQNVISLIKEEFPYRIENYIDWNIDSGDATATRLSTDKIIRNVDSLLGSYKIEVILMHDLDNKDTTAEALNKIIKNHKDRGYKFKTLNEMQPWELEYLERIRVVNR